jgi:hypothetical protein
MKNKSIKISVEDYERIKKRSQRDKRSIKAVVSLAINCYMGKRLEARNKAKFVVLFFFIFLFTACPYRFAQANNIEKATQELEQEFVENKDVQVETIIYEQTDEEKEEAIRIAKEVQRLMKEE